MSDFKIPKTEDELQEFADLLREISDKIGFKVSARGWCYILEDPPYSLITKAQFDVIENIINNKLRRTGMLPVDFVNEEEGRRFSGIEEPTKETPEELTKQYLEDVLETEYFYTPNWWKDEKYYIQMVVEKIDLKTLFADVCRKYHIPICSSKGWQSMLMRAEYARRFKEAENKGLKCVLLYCGDHDPDGLRIGEFLRKNLEDLTEIKWNDGECGYDPSKLNIKRFGLNHDFIKGNNLSWTENLITGSKKDLASPSHRNHHMDYVQDYIKMFGIRKCEANSLVVNPDAGRELCKGAILEWLGEDAINRFRERRFEVVTRLKSFRRKTGLQTAIEKAIKMIDKEGEEND